MSISCTSRANNDCRGKKVTRTQGESAMTEQQSAKVLIQPVTVQKGDHMYSIDSWPLPTAGSEARAVELTQPEPDCLVLGPGKRTVRHWLKIALPIVTTSAGTVAGLIAMIVHDGDTAGALFAVALVLLLVGPLIFLAL